MIILTRISVIMVKLKKNNGEINKFNSLFFVPLIVFFSYRMQKASPFQEITYDISVDAE